MGEVVVGRRLLVEEETRMEAIEVDGYDPKERGVKGGRREVVDGIERENIDTDRFAVGLGVAHSAVVSKISREIF